MNQGERGRNMGHFQRKFPDLAYTLSDLIKYLSSKRHANSFYSYQFTHDIFKMMITDFDIIFSYFWACRKGPLVNIVYCTFRCVQTPYA